MKEGRKSAGALAVIISRPVAFQVSEDWTSFQVASVMLENWSVRSKGSSPLF